jgi:uroporphyrin-III C-methyltransferase / precorrin-2 dehydrogenase / sirohydrochlorin ferrochelatase
MSSFPIFVDLDRTPPLVAGASSLAVAKARLLLKRCRRVAVAAPDAARAIGSALPGDSLEILDRWPAIDDIRGRPLVIAATGNDVIDARISADARALGVPVNVPDRPELCTFILPAIVDRAPVTIAIGTEGSAPVLATQLRAWLERELHPRLGRVAMIASRFRSAVAIKVPAGPKRRAFWEAVLAGAPAKAILAGDEGLGRRLIEAAIDGNEAAHGDQPGRVILVGAGPGDPELLTLTAIRALKAADVVLHDHLITDAILDLARREAHLVPVGKRCGQHSMPQAEINRLIISHARAGNTVVRLKGGDPFVFGRAAEEMAAAQAAGLDVEVVPGITAAQGCAAAIGLPLTLRGTVRQVSLVTGATTDGAADLDWETLARPGQAFAIYMGVRTASTISRNLLSEGAAPATPVIIVENGTLASQRVITTHLGDLADAVRAKKLHGPAILLVGLDWAGAGLQRPASVETFVAAPRRHPPEEQRIAFHPEPVPLAS